MTTRTSKKNHRNQRNRRKGQALSEYLILTALIAVGSLAIIQVLSHNIRARLSVISEAIRGHEKTIEGREASERYYQVLDMGDFQKAMQDNSDD